MNLDEWRAWAERKLTWVRLGTWALLVLGVGACTVRSANGPADPYIAEASPTTAEAPSPTGAVPRTPVAGFDEIAFRITTESGEELDWCALLAATEEARAQGLMERRDLAGHDAMVFRFQEPTTGRFYMFHTVMPLSIAWFDEGGDHVSQTDMPPCPAEDADDCPTYPAAAPFVHAIEVPQGGLDELGIGPGARLSFPGGACA